MGYLDDEEYDQDYAGGPDPIFSKRRLEQILLGTHAPDLYPNINEPSAPARSDQMSGLYGSPYPNIEGGEGPTQSRPNSTFLSGDFGAPGSWSDPKILARTHPELFGGGPREGGGGGSFDPTRTRSSIYEPGPNEAAYAEALRKPRPEYQQPGKMPWWKTLLEIAMPSTRAIFADPEQEAQRDYERRTGTYEGDIASKRGAASLEIGERDRQRRGILDEMKAERDANLYGRQMETQQKQGAYYEKKMNEPEKKTPFQEYLDDPEGYGKFSNIQHPVRGKGVKTVNVNGRIKVIDADTGEELNDLGEAPGKGGASAPDLKKSKIAATRTKNQALLKLNQQYMTPEKRAQAKQDIQDAFEQELEAAGHNVEHYEYPVEKAPAEVKPVAQPGLISRAASSIGSMFGGGAGGGGVQERMSKSGKPIISKDGGKTWEYK